MALMLFLFRWGQCIGPSSGPFQLGLPSTRKNPELYVYFVLNGKTRDLPVVTESAANDAALLCTVNVATHYLGKLLLLEHYSRNLFAD